MRIDVMRRARASEVAKTRLRSSWPRRLRNLGVVVTTLIALYAIIGFLVIPPIARPQLDSTLSRELGRHATRGRAYYQAIYFGAFATSASSRDDFGLFTDFRMTISGGRTLLAP